MKPFGLIIDNFAGGGGASTGIEAGMGRKVDHAYNHDASAIAMHAAKPRHLPIDGAEKKGEMSLRGMFGLAAGGVAAAVLPTVPEVTGHLLCDGEVVSVVGSVTVTMNATEAARAMLANDEFIGACLRRIADRIGVATELCGERVLVGSGYPFIDPVKDAYGGSDA